VIESSLSAELTASEPGVIRPTKTLTSDIEYVI
jgi:hypothetical protein